MRMLLLATLLFGAGESLAAPVYSVNQAQTELKVTNEHCIYGRGVNKALEQASYNQVKKDIRSNKETILAGLTTDANIKKEKLDYIGLLLEAGLQADDFQHDIYLQGNDTCSKSSAILAIDDKLNFETLFSFQAPHQLHFISQQGQEITDATDLLNQYGIAVDQDTLLATLKRHAQYNQLGSAKAYFSLDLSQYQSQLSGNTNQIYISGSERFLPYLSQYLSSKGFDVVTQSSQAFWQLDISGKVESEKYIDFVLTLSNSKSNRPISLKNNARALPGVDMANSASFEKFFKVHLELVKLVSKLEIK